jgi:hypothetical protein
MESFWEQDLIPSCAKVSNRWEPSPTSILESDMVREGPAQQPPYPAEKARGGEIVLRRRWQRAVFIGGLVGAVLLVLILRIAAVI